MDKKLNILPSVILAIAVASIIVWAVLGTKKQGGTDLPNSAREANVANFRLRAQDENPSQYLKTLFIACFKKNEARWRSPCFKELAQIVIQQFSLREALEALAEIQYEQNPNIAGQCHAVVHYLAQNEYQKTKNAAESFSQCRIVCGEGCYHGVVEAYMEEQNLGGADEMKMQNVVSKICDTVKNDPRRIIYEHCVHGVGHAFMLLTKNDLPQSLQLCSRFFRGNEDEHNQCLGGALMENSFNVGSPDHPTRFVDPADLKYPCTILEKEYQEICYGAQSVLALGNRDWERARNFCMSIPSAYQDSCFASLGANAVVAFSQNFSELKKVCDNAPLGDLRHACIAGTVAFLGYVNGGNTPKFVGYCRLVDQEYEEACFKELGTAIGKWSPAGERNRECQRVSKTPEEYQWCSDTSPRNY